MSAAALSAVSFSGLVSLPTSGKEAKTIEIETILNRWKKLRKAVRESARLHSFAAGTRRALMVTLTYAEVGANEPRDISDCLSHMRKWCKRNGGDFRFVWVAELQGRGALHYHIIIWLPASLKLPAPDTAGWWPHGSSNVEVVRSGIGYMTKYASKMRSKMKEGVEFPKHFRMHGCGGLEPDAREHRAHHLRPQWLQDLTTPDLRVRPAKGGGFFSKLTGEWFESPWQILGFRFVPGVGRIVIVGRKPLKETTS